MPRENSFSDSEGRSLTPDPEDEIHYEEPAAEAASPTYSIRTPWSPTGHTVPHPFSASRRSLHSRAPHPIPGWQNLTPKEKFRITVRRVMAMHRGASILTTGGRVGAEPGVDPRRASADALYSHISQDCVIEVVDYSAVRSSFGRMTNKEFVNFMGDKSASQREPWVKVRWINIGGMSWDVIKAVSIKYNLHPLALEDVFHGHKQNRSKADYYSRHLFLRILCHELGDPDYSPSGHSAAQGSTLTGEPRSMSPEPMRDEDRLNGVKGGDVDEEKTMYGTPPTSRQSTTKRRRNPLLPTNRRDVDGMPKASNSASNLARLLKREGDVKDARKERQVEEVSIEALKQGERVNVKVSPMFLFLFRDGTVISIHPEPDLDFTVPITQRLRSRDTVLRTSADPSLLVHALLDLIVDRSLQVIDEYHTKINKFERRILLKPKMRTVRELHILSGDLILHKRTLEPIKTLIYGLRRYDVDRCAALIDMSDPANANTKVVGFMSHKSKIYLADVFDHMEYILTSLDMFTSISENLIDYTFNLASYEMNEVMRRLTLATIIFLPLTLLTGYFGMNFEAMWSVQNNSDWLFWKIAIPLMIFIIPVFMYSDLTRVFHFIQKKMVTKQAVKQYKRA
ncbi:magnesium transporter [Crucibulum laeve]|uniref:Magnesium transporter n=1 Tax=Crucibulum laeve TaxID=68775 RepID=A0A5C3MCC0_9AGAR|nr:magnesium transporter [Crucibulum laeve]